VEARAFHRESQKEGKYLFWQFEVWSFTMVGHHPASIRLSAWKTNGTRFLVAQAKTKLEEQIASEKNAKDTNFVLVPNKLFHLTPLFFFFFVLVFGSSLI
jgi:hypothetical protein